MVIGAAPTNIIQNKKKKQLVQPQINKAVNPPIVNVATEAANLARRNVLPGEAGQTPEIANQLRAIYAGQANQNVANPPPIPMSAEQQAQQEKLGQQLNPPQPEATPQPEANVQPQQFTTQQFTDELGNVRTVQVPMTLQSQRAEADNLVNFLMLGASASTSIGGVTAKAGKAVQGIAQGIAPKPSTRISGVISGNGLKVASLGKKLLGIASAVGVGIATPRILMNDAKAAIISNVQTADIIMESVKAGIMSSDEAIAQFNQIDAQINELERSIHGWSSVSILNFLGGGKDREVDIINARLNLQIKKQALINLITGVQQ